MKLRFKQVFTFLIGWPFSLLALYFITKTFLPKSNEIITKINTINPWLLAAGIVFFFCYFFLRSILWHLLLNSFGYEKLYFFETAFLWAQSEFKRYIPGNVWSFLGRSFAFSKHNVSQKDIAKSLVYEMEYIFIACIIVSLLSLPFLSFYFFPFLKQIYNPFLLLSTVFIICLLYAYSNRIFNFLKFKKIHVINYFLPQFTANRSLLLISVSITAVMFFGLGYYFVISSLFLLNPFSILSLTGFFVLSFLIGLLSFITPTGLGVREGILTAGLLKIMPITLAGFSSLFSRFILILTELLFILFSYLITKSSRKLAVFTELFLREHIFEILLVLLITIFSVYIGTTSVFRYNNFYAGRFDLGNMDQTVWNTKHGRFFQFTNPDGTNIVSRLAFHADFILIFLTPFYYLWEDPRMLLIIQAVIVGLGAVFVYGLAKHLLNNKLLALIFAFSYLLNPSIQRASLFDFHGVTLVTTLLIGTWYFLVKKRYFWFIVFALLSASTKEQIWIITGLLGLFLIVRTFLDGWSTQKKVIMTKPLALGLGLSLLSACMFYLLIWHAIPNASNSKHFALSYFQEDNDSPSQLLKSIVFTPQKTIIKVIQHDRLEYIKQVLQPVGFLPLFAPWFLVFPSTDIVLNLLSDKSELHQIYYQYTSAITPFLFIASIYVTHYVLKKKRNLLVILLSSYILLFALYSSYLHGPLPWSREPNMDMYTKPEPHAGFINDKLKQIPTDYKIAASNNLGSHLSQREYIYTIPYGMDQADMILFLLSDATVLQHSNEYADVIQKLRNDQKYFIIWEKDNFIAFKKINN